jgi:hypothetical protein
MAAKLPGKPLKPESQALTNEILYAQELKQEVPKSKIKPKTSSKWTTRRFN